MDEFDFKCLFIKAIRMNTIQINIALFCCIFESKSNSPWIIVTKADTAQFRICKQSLCFFQETPDSCTGKKSPFRHFQIPSSGPTPSLFLCEEIRPSHCTLMSISCTVSISVTFSAQFPTAFYLGQQLGHNLSSFHAQSSKVQNSSQRPLGFLSTPPTLDPFHTWPLNLNSSSG